MRLSPTVAAAAWSAMMAPAQCQTFPGFEPATSSSLVVAWGTTPLNYSGEILPLDLVVTKSLPTVGLPANATCDGPYILLMVDPDATQGDIETQAGLHTIQGNFTCSSADSLTTAANATFHALTSSSAPLAPFIPPSPQAKNPVVTHRYTLLLFAQPAGYAVPADLAYALPLNYSDVYNRLDFDVLDFAASVGDVVAATYFDVVSPKAADNSSSTTASASSTSSAASATSTGTGGATASPTSLPEGAAAGVHSVFGAPAEAGVMYLLLLVATAGIFSFL
ncbi:hypothetical protein GGR56DRAFT_653282 [Xylariaceae sp. FL0804]|nr:hypothetical protein GGR56DRAFT_653282 [Xylariaceae sp. FL0804]